MIGLGSKAGNSQFQEIPWLHSSSNSKSIKNWSGSVPNFSLISLSCIPKRASGQKDLGQVGMKVS